jgi:UDP-N-acetylmuramoyl-L-alanyl-D-glutamate--2,6-diaminopimelate ligase
VLDTPARDLIAPLNLERLAAIVPGALVVGDPGVTVRRIVFDSRQVGPADLYVALSGTVVDGARYVPQAFANGAAAAVVERHDALPPGLSGLLVPSARRALGLLSAAREGWPSRRLRLVGVTGTDGKTTTSSLIASILRQAGRRVGLVSTVRAEIGDAALDTGFHTTTPDAPDLQRYLRLMVEQGTQDAVLEVTSHGLAQERVAGCEFDIAVMTNVTSDHLNLHGTIDAYLAVKLRLFEELAGSARKPGVPKAIVYNLDDRSAAPIAHLDSDRKLGYSLELAVDVRPRAVRFSADAVAFDAITPAGEFPVTVPLPGWYNVANSLAAIGAGLVLDAPIAAIQRGLAQFAGVPGRLEKVDLGQPFEVFVDFAHTPNSLEKVLSLARERCRRRVSVVFGCAGLRDEQKRPVMGEIAARYADRIYLTAEDPRTESLDVIIEAIAEGCRRAGRRESVDFWRIPDRAEAIDRAVSEAGEGDLVLVTGKGHERSMCFGDDETPWSDQDAVRAALQRRLTRTG